MNIFHELGAIEQPLPPTPPVKKAGYNEVLKKNLKISQLKILQRRAAARAEEAKAETLKDKEISEKALQEAVKAKHASEQQKIKAAKASFEVHGNNAKAEEAMAIAEAEEAIIENAENTKAELEKAEIAKAELDNVPQVKMSIIKIHGPFRCSLCRVLFNTREKFKEHQQEDWAEKTKCYQCGYKLNCMALKRHIKNTHNKDISCIVHN